MANARELLHRYRYALAALGVSLAVHAALITGLPGQFGRAPQAEAASYSVELAPLPDVVVGIPGPAAAAPPPPRPPRPRTPRKPTEALAELPPLATGYASAADALPALAEAPPPLAAAEPEAAAPVEPPKPEMLAAAVPAAPVPALEPRDFPVDALPPNVSIRYALTSPFADGRAEYSWTREGDKYSIHGAAEATGFFTLFLEGRILQETNGSVTSRGLRPERFVERKPQGPDEGLSFDWDKGSIEFRRNDEVKQGALAENTVDWLSMIFQLAHRPPQGESVVLKVYTQRKLYEFELKVLGTETLQLPIGTVKALHLRHATSDPKETVDVWLGIDHHYLPVKLRYPVARNRFMVDQVATAISAR